MDKVILDTDTFSEILKGVDAHVGSRAAAYWAVYGRFTVSAVTLMELVKGFHKLQRQDRVQQIVAELDSQEVIPFGSDEAHQAGKIYADLERTGQPIGRADPMIAGTALHHNLALVTGNTAHYERIQQLGYGLRIENWREP